MPSAPRVVYATRDTTSPVTVHVRPQELPIIVVPGIMGSRLTDPRTDDLGPTMLRQHVSATRTRSYAEIYEWLEPGELLANPPKRWKADLRMADASRFHHPTGR